MSAASRTLTYRSSCLPPTELTYRMTLADPNAALSGLWDHLEALGIQAISVN